MMRIGTVTYNLAKSWDIPTIIKNCSETGFEGVELRTTHAHGVELTLSKSERETVRKQFADSPVSIAGLGSVYEYHSTDPAEVRRNVEGSKEYIKLAADVGSPGIKVRPNNAPDEVPLAATLEQIGRALREVAQFGSDYGVEVRLEVHGRITCNPPNIRTILDHADHWNLKACWNSNDSDMGPDGTIRKNFNLLKHDIGLVHMTDLANPGYPWRELFSGLRSIGYKGFCLAEVPESAEPLRFMRYYRALWMELCNP
ncbi:MAG TPA: sugar phosphate isomerase/epimerase [Candidatus Latescibacteria bacterium]|nr:sugar phosphate isomerase/epimerase [Candidatus Latescibacterota bacterium]